MAYWGGSNIRCEICNKSFEKAYGTCQRFCSNACKQKAYRRRHNGRYVADQERNAETVTLGQVESNTKRYVPLQ